MIEIEDAVLSTDRRGKRLDGLVIHSIGRNLKIIEIGREAIAIKEFK